MEKARTVFFVSDRTGITAETLGHSLLTQFDGVNFRQVTVPFLSTLDKAQEFVGRLHRTAEEEGEKPIVFSTLIQDDIRELVENGDCVFLDFFDAFIGPLEQELQVKSSHTAGRAHGMHHQANYTTRIDAMNYALANDDGVTTRNYDKADVILVGVSRSGKTPTCLYLALHYGVYAANYPLTEEELQGSHFPKELLPHRHKLFGLTIDPGRLQQIRTERRPDSRYASAAQVNLELRQAENLFRMTNVPFTNTTTSSIEEIATTIIHETGISRRFF